MSATIHKIAIVPDTKALPFGAVIPVAAAIHKQIATDFGPAWKLAAHVEAYPNRAAVPHGYWPVYVGSENQGGGGVHLDDHRQPYALVDITSDWSVTASHECMEMCADPAGNRLHAAQSIDPDFSGRVRYLVEVADPPEAFSYEIDGVAVSDFILPDYYAHDTVPGTRYSHAGNIAGPLGVPSGGYISWVEPTGVWKQLTNFGTPKIVTLGKFDNSFPSLRSWVDAVSCGM